MRLVEKPNTNKIRLSADDLIRMRDRAVNKDAYIDLLIDWMKAADKRVIDLQRELYELRGPE